MFAKDASENTSYLRNLESKVQSYARIFPRVFHRARNSEVWDINGRRYLDFLAGAGSLNYGHNNPLLKEALVEHIRCDRITQSLDLHTTTKEMLMEAMWEIILRPRELDDYAIQFTGPTGTNAVEAALKIARKVTGRTNVVAFTNGFHGVSMGALAATGNQHHRGGAGMPLYGTIRMPFDGYFGNDIDTIDYIDQMLSDPSSGIDKPAAMIVETVQGEGGLKAAKVSWLRRLQTLCNEENILLIIDDIQAGCGRTGTFFSFESAGLKPDIVTLSKSFSGYGLPLAIVLLQRNLDEWKPGEHNGTFRGNNHAFVTATAALRHFWQTDEFATEVDAKSVYLNNRLQAMVDHFQPNLTEVRGRGMMQGVYCADPGRAAAITANAFARGLIIERSGPRDEVIKCLMPLTIGLDEMKEGLDILQQAMLEEFSAGEVSEQNSMEKAREPVNLQLDSVRLCPS